MANRRVLVKRRKTARNIRKITRTMQLISTARLQKFHGRAVASKPYTEKLAELVADLTRAGAGTDHPLLAERSGSGGAAVLVVSSNRGLCGGYNSNVLRLGVEHLDHLAGEGRATDVHVVGKKGTSYFEFLGREMDRRTTDISDFPAFDQVEPIANDFLERFAAGTLDSVDVVFTRFISAGKQVPTVERLLPLAAQVADDGEAVGPTLEYEFSPEPRQLLDELLPASFRIRLFQAFVDSAVSEQVARMVAMKAATDAAGDMIKRLTQQYNRARQTSITMELLDIVGGANALS